MLKLNFTPAPTDREFDRTDTPQENGLWDLQLIVFYRIRNWNKGP